MFNSIKRILLSFVVVSFILLVLAITLVIHDIKEDFQFGATLDYLGWFESSSFKIEVLARDYYISQCLKGEALISKEDVKKEIDTMKTESSKAVLALREGKSGAKPVSDISQDAVKLLDEMLSHY